MNIAGREDCFLVIGEIPRCSVTLLCKLDVTTAGGVLPSDFYLKLTSLLHFVPVIPYNCMVC